MSGNDEGDKLDADGYEFVSEPDIWRITNCGGWRIVTPNSTGFHYSMACLDRDDAIQTARELNAEIAARRAGEAVPTLPPQIKMIASGIHASFNAEFPYQPLFAGSRGQCVRFDDDVASGRFTERGQNVSETRQHWIRWIRSEK